jgi:putative heme transporter
VSDQPVGDGTHGDDPRPAEPDWAADSGHVRAVDTSEVSGSLDRRRTIIGALVTVLVLGVIFAFLIPKFGGYADAWAYVKAMTPQALALLALSSLVTILVYVWPYQSALPGLSYKPGFIVRQTSFAISNAIPAGGAFGLAVQFAMLGSYSVPLAVATAGIAVTSLWSVLMTLTLPVFGVFAALTTGAVRPQWVWGALAGLAATALAIVGLWLILRSEPSARRVGGWLDRLAAPVNRRRKQPWNGTAAVLDLRNSTSDVLLSRWRWVTGSNYIVVLCQFGVLWFAIAGVAGSPVGISVAGAFAAFALSRMASMIPVTPGGLGTVDAALIALLVTFGLPQSQAVAANLVWRAASFIPQVSVGLVTFLWWRVQEARAGRPPSQAA